MMSKARRQAIDWLCKLSEIQFQLALFLAEDDYDSFLEAKDLLEQLAREVVDQKKSNPELKPDGGGMVSYPLPAPGTWGKTIHDIIQELEIIIESVIAEVEKKIEELSGRAIRGKLVQKRVSCGKPNCHCCPHGPYWYLRKPDGKYEYVRRSEVEAVRKGIQAWEELRELQARLKAVRDLWKSIRSQLNWLQVELDSILPQTPGAGRG